MTPTSLDQRIRLLIGEMIIQNTALQLENEQLKVQVAATSKPADEPMKYDEHHGTTADLQPAPNLDKPT